MKKMQYINGRQDKPVREILDKGKYKGYRYVIISFGTHPCAYVEIPHMHPYWNQTDYDELDIKVHGGLTFSGEQPFLNNKFCIGWDYWHCDDYNPLCPELGGKKWKTWEIKKDVFDVINQLCKQSLHAPKIMCPVCHIPMGEGDIDVAYGPDIRKIEIKLACRCGCEFLYRRGEFIHTNDLKD